MKFSIEIELRNAPIEVLEDIVKTLSVWGEDISVVKFSSIEQTMQEQRDKFDKAFMELQLEREMQFTQSKLEKTHHNESPDILGLTITEPDQITKDDK